MTGRPPLTRGGKDFLQPGSDRVEGARDLGSQRGNGGNNHHGDEGSDQGIFDGGDGALVDIQLSKLVGNGGTNIVHEHGADPFKTLTQQSDQTTLTCTHAKTPRILLPPPST